MLWRWKPKRGIVVLSPMPRYFFNVYNDDTTIDDEGMELSDPAAAKVCAIQEARVLAADTVLQGHLVGHHRIEILDEARAVIGSVRFDEAVEMRA